MVDFCGFLVVNGGRGNGTPLQYSCLENPMDGGAWKAAVHGITESRTWLNDFTFTFHFHALEKEMASHSSVLAWRIPGTAEPGGLPPMGSHRVGHNWSDLAAAAAVWLLQQQSLVAIQTTWPTKPSSVCYHVLPRKKKTLLIPGLWNCVSLKSSSRVAKTRYSCSSHLHSVQWTEEQIKSWI